MDKGKIQNIKLMKKKSPTVREREKRKRYAERIRKQKPERDNLFNLLIWF